MSIATDAKVRELELLVRALEKRFDELEKIVKREITPKPNSTRDHHTKIYIQPPEFHRD